MACKMSLCNMVEVDMVSPGWTFEVWRPNTSDEGAGMFASELVMCFRWSCKGSE